MWKYLFKRKTRDSLPREVLAPETRPVIYDFKIDGELDRKEPKGSSRTLVGFNRSEEDEELMATV